MNKSKEGDKAMSAYDLTKMLCAEDMAVFAMLLANHLRLHPEEKGRVEQIFRERIEHKRAELPQNELLKGSKRAERKG